MTTARSLAQVLTLTAVQALADTRTFARGKAYFHDGVVSRLEVDGESMVASVRGTHRYRVELSAEDGTLAYDCTCPVGNDGTFCKHAVAVALSWLENTGEEVFHADEASTEKPKRKRKSHAEIIHDYLITLDAAALRDLLEVAAGHDRDLRDRLLFAARSAAATDPASRKLAVKQATRVSRPLAWNETHVYADNLDALVHTMRGWLAGPCAHEVIALAEQAIAQVEASLEQIDDSNGEIMPAILDLVALHRDACQQVRPDPVKLAERLFLAQTQGHWDTFRDVLPAYAESLGEPGLQRYRALVQAAWDALPELKADARRTRYAVDGRRSILEHAMKAIAKQDGHVDALISIYSKDLSTPFRFLEIAQLCAEHGRDDEALAWAERGLALPGGPEDLRLVAFCIEVYVQRKAFDRADALAWERFERYASAEGFTLLMQVAGRTGHRESMRERAVERLWAYVEDDEAAERPKRHGWRPSARTELVKIFLAARQDGLAWDAAAGGPVGMDVLQRLAKARGKTHPRDAIALYQRMLPKVVERGTSGARYDDAVALIKAMGVLRARLGEQAEFATEVDAIRVTYRAKRKLVGMLAGVGVGTADDA